MMLSGDIPPNQTVYIKNLNDKLNKQELRRSLYALFSQFGRILDVVALKTPRLRGQAWVVFSEITAASNAFRQMQNFPFYDKPMRIQYAKHKSDCLAKADGTFDKNKNKKPEDKAAAGKQRSKPTEEAPPTAQSNGASKQASRQGEDAARAPNNVLFVENLPHETTSMMLQILFQQYPGFREVRMIPAKPGIAFVDFTDDAHSSVAMEALQAFKITPHSPMSISFAKK